MEVKTVAAVPAQTGSDRYFTGSVQVRSLFSASEPARMSCGCVTFDPSARSAWHAQLDDPHRGPGSLERP